MNIVQTANSSGLTTLVAAIQAANLTMTLSNPGTCTVFAPNNAAFAKLPAGTVENLLKPENKNQLTQILLYHVIMYNWTSEYILNMTLPMDVKTLQGSSIKLSKNGSNIMVNTANIIQANVMATNGIIHVIDTVLIPPATTTAAPSSATYLNGNLALSFVLVFAFIFSFLRL